MEIQAIYKEFKNSNIDEKLWVQIENKIYDVSAFKHHPGGRQVLLEQGGKDATKAFTDAQHPPHVANMMKTYLVHELPVYDFTEMKKHNSESDCWIAIHKKAYDITPFITHPGGREILLEHSGRDATEAFEDHGHTEVARMMLDDFYIGEYDNSKDQEIEEKSQPIIMFILPILFIVLLTILVRYI